VQGHVDGVGTVVSVADDGFARKLEVEAPQQLLRYAVVKGSITIDGVSLTVAELKEGSFTVSLIPETLKRTTLGQARAGTRVNLEVDVLAKYVERLIQR
jgi:riboflavin synthase